MPGAQRELRRGGKIRRMDFHHDSDDGSYWNLPDGLGYSREDELMDELGNLPSQDEVAELCSVLRVSTLRGMSEGVINGGVRHLRENADRVELAKLINSWIATAEETIAAGRNLNRIAARRKKND